MTETTYSVIVLVEDTETNFIPFLTELSRQFSELALPHELVLAINGPGLFAQTCLREWPEDAAPVQVFELTRKVPSGICLQAVLSGLRGNILITCGTYQQIALPGLENLIAIVRDDQADLALPWRKDRIDPLVNQWQSKAYNWLVQKLTKTRFHDLSSTLRVMRREVLEETILYGDFFRYLPILAEKRGYRVLEVPAQHVEERGKVGFYGIRSYVSRLVDLLTLRFNLGFVRKPLRYFGLRGGLLFLFGIGFMGFSVLSKLIWNDNLGDSSALMIGLVLILTGSGIWGVGLLGEILTFALGRKRKDYIVERVLE